ncbi:MAG: PglZ domain-containing protein [Actinomycetota bacterium]|nr:PglZ domain-containing protein [Actinomycetota bacterium]
MTRLREELLVQLAGKLDRHRVVVWADPQGEYREVATDLAPEGSAFEQYRGSWYELRRRVESKLSQPEPRLVVYIDAEEPDEDPLAELRALGTKYTRQLATLLRQTMTPELTAAKLDEIAKAATTLVQAEALIEGGAAGGPSHLLKVLGPHEPNELALKLATKGQEVLNAHPDLFEGAAQFLHDHLGIRPPRPDDLHAAIARHLVLVELAVAVPQLPEGLRSSYQSVSDQQRRRCEALLDRWKHDQRLTEAFDDAMTQASRDLTLSTQLSWHDALIDIDTVPSYDALAFSEYVAGMEAERFVEAEDLAAARLQSRWVVKDETQETYHRWRVAHAAAQVHRLIKASPDEPEASVASRLRRYTDQAWQIDRAHRRLELALLALTDRAPVETVVLAARWSYDQWLDAHLRQFSAAVQADGLETGDYLLQGHIHMNAVAPRAAHGCVAYFMVDALRYELAQDLVDALRHQFPDGSIELEPAVGLVPSITAVGMANLCPGAERGLSLQLTRNDKLVVKIDGHEVMTPEDRVARLRAAHGKVADLRLDDIFRFSEQDLREQIDASNLVLVRSQEIDEQGETGKLSIGLTGFDATVQQLSRAVARLARHSISQFVISADHGFLALTREIGAHMIIPKPGGLGEVHRRAFIGRGGTTNEASLRLPLSKIGLPGDLDVVMPRGLALIAAGGARGFFHGGLSPQEIVVPVLTVEVQPPEGSSVLIVEANIAPRITTHIFTGRVALPHTLLSEPVTVRPTAVRTSDGRDVGVMATAGGAEEGEGLVRLHPGDDITLGFRVIGSLAKGDKIALRVFDARTDRKLGESAKPSTVARRLEVDDEPV